MRSSQSVAHPVRSRERNLREASLTGARALTRFLVALIENLGANDRLGSRREPGWPQNTRYAAFGPTPLGAEIERIMAASSYRQETAEPSTARRDAVTGLPAHDETDEIRADERPEPARREAGTTCVSAASPPVSQTIQAPAPARAPPSSPVTGAGPSQPTLAERAPLWQQPFFAAPGVRYMRTPDHLLRRARAPIEPIAIEEALAAADLPIDLIESDGLTFDPDFMDEVAQLNNEDQSAFDSRAGLPRRLRMMSGFAVDLPAPANDLAREIAKAVAMEAAPDFMKRFAVSVRPKAKVAVQTPPALSIEDVTSAASSPVLSSAISSSAILSRVTLAAPEMPVAKRKPALGIEWEYPSVDLLAVPRKADGVALTADMLEQNARLLETTLEDFGIRGEIIHVRAGPVVTLYELEPAPGMKSSRVIGLADDIARSMSALSARVAVVPGRNAIGIELPNERRETVYFREMVESEEFGDSKHKLAIALGKTIGGEPVIAELAKMPHLLVAGTTGSGKSVAINTMILSLLYRLKPEECRLIMVDPKMLELSVYDGIPHLLTPVVTDPKKAVVALKWAVREMEDRYKKMSKLGVRNIDGFNARVGHAKANGETIMMQATTGFDRETGKPTTEEQAMDLTSLPYIVVIVDEMADLMMVAGKDIEGAIQRLAQMARAAGIHLIMATQRPSVDVITGTIKANFPTRISFQVTSKIDSRTILGEQGAEQLLGQGDMLHMQGGGRIYRVHGPFVSDDEVEKVVAHLKSQGQPDYLDSVTDDVEGEAPADEDDGEDGAVFDKSAMGEDEGNLYEQAVKVVLRDKKSSVSYVQRRLQVGYNKAASLIERMEKEGILGPASHTGKREILAHSRGRVISGVPIGDDED